MSLSSRLLPQDEPSRESHFHYATSPRWRPRARQILDHLRRLVLKPTLIHDALVVSTMH